MGNFKYVLYNSNMSVLDGDLRQGPNRKKLVVLVVLGVLILGIVAIVGVFIYGRLNRDVELSRFERGLSVLFDSTAPIPVQSGGLYGFISPEDGRWLIEPTFMEVSRFYGEFAIASDPELRRSKIINRSGQVVKDDFPISEVQYVRGWDIWIIDGALYNSSLERLSAATATVMYLENGYSFYHARGDVSEEGVMDYNGRVVYSCGDVGCDAEIGLNDPRLHVSYAVIRYHGDDMGHIVALDGSQKKIYSTHGDIRAVGNNIFVVSSGRADAPSVKSLVIADGEIVHESNQDVRYLDVVDGQLLITDRNDRQEMVDVKTGNRSAIDSLDEDDILFRNLTGADLRACRDGDAREMSQNGRVVIACTDGQIERLSDELFLYVKQRTRQQLVLHWHTTLEIVDLYRGRAVANFGVSDVFFDDESPFIVIDLADGGRMVRNLLSGQDIVLPARTIVSLGSNYFRTSVAGRATYYNTAMRAIREI